MKTLALMSIIFVTIAAPAAASLDPSARRGMGRMVLFMFAFNALYVAYLTLIHPVLFEPSRW